MTKMAPLIINNANIGYKNFEGRVSATNKYGERTFVIFFEDDVAKDMQDRGWNIKWPKDKLENPDSEKQAFLPVKLKFRTRDNRPTSVKIVKIMGDNHFFLGEEDVKDLDKLKLLNVDLKVRPYEFEPGRYSAFLDTIYATVEMDPFFEKYGY